MNSVLKEILETGKCGKDPKRYPSSMQWIQKKASSLTGLSDR
jgi:hypothetical protein